MLNAIANKIARHIKEYPKRLSRAENLRLFLGIAFPLHIWTIYQVFNDLEWVAARTQPADALGYAGYSMAFTLLESTLIFTAVWVVGLLTPAAWRGIKLVAILTWISWGVVFSAAVEQMITSLPESTIPAFVGWMFSAGRPLWIAYPLLVGIWSTVILSAGLPLLAFVRSENACQKINNILERINVLTILFIVVDVIGLLIILVRNIRY